jgi:hypothetical protein
MGSTKQLKKFSIDTQGKANEQCLIAKKTWKMQALKEMQNGRQETNNGVIETVF